MANTLSLHDALPISNINNVLVWPADFEESPGERSAAMQSIVSDERRKRMEERRAARIGQTGAARTVPVRVAVVGISGEVRTAAGP
jgi:hypothetical protein